jgi:hypothetical protein
MRFTKFFFLRGRRSGRLGANFLDNLVLCTVTELDRVVKEIIVFIL